MAGRNIGGESSNTFYALPKGVLRVAELDSLDNPGAQRDLGNVDSFRMTYSIETLEHFSSRSSTRTKDFDVVKEISIDVEIEMQEWQFENLAFQNLGDVSDYNQPDHQPSLGDGFLVVPNPAYTGTDLSDKTFIGRTYPMHVVDISATDSIVAGAADATLLGTSDLPKHDNRIYNVVSTAVTLYDDATATTPLTRDVDYVVDEDYGTITLKNTAAVRSIASAAASERYIRLYLEYSGTGTAPPDLGQVQAFTQTERSYLLSYEMEDSAQAGQKSELILFKVRLRPNGDQDWINSDDDSLSSITVSGSALQNTNVDPQGNGYYTIRRVA